MSTTTLTATTIAGIRDLDMDQVRTEPDRQSAASAASRS